jgi:hypothetical protein
MSKKLDLAIQMIIFITITITLVFSAMAAQSGREIIYLVGCDDVEVVSDIEYSVKQFESYAKEQNISLIKKDSKKCGYILIYNGKKHYEKSALTDVDLMELCKKYFKIE